MDSVAMIGVGMGMLGSVPSAVEDAIGWLAGALGWLGNLLDPVGEILTNIWPPLCAAIAGIVLLRAVRWGLLIWRGRTPRVQVSTFAWTTSEGADREATWVTSLFREQLAALRLDALDPLPERAPGAPLVEIVEGVGQGVGRDIAGAAGRLFRAAWPDSSYEVWGTLRPQEGGGGRVSVQLIERRRGNRTLLNVALEEASWEDGAREAAMAVAGALYPQVREGDRGPWTQWSRPVPRSLMGHYHAARRYEEADRLEHALAEYHAALDQDPLNPNLRLKIAMLQERLALYLDAWVTYEAIVDDSDPRAWHGPDRRVYLLALYRLAVMLSNGRVAGQWVKGSAKKSSTRRDKERKKRRAELMRSLERNQLFTERKIKLRVNELPVWGLRTASVLIAFNRANVLLLLLRTIDAEASEPSDALAVFREADEGEDREWKIEAVLRILGLRRLEELEAALRLFPPFSRRWRPWWIRRARTLRQWLAPEFARSAVRTSKLLVRIRIAASLEIQAANLAKSAEAFPNKARWTKEIRQAHHKLTRRWPFPAVNIWRGALHFLAPRRRWTNRREDSWQLHYNAACAAASILRRDSVLGPYEEELEANKKAPEGAKKKIRKPLPGQVTREKVLDRAIAQLEEYAFRAGSDRVATQAEWVAIDDPDLRGIRETEEFKLWAGHHLPRDLPSKIASRKADVKHFTARVVLEGARVLALAWRERADDPYPSAAELVDWWQFEQRIWNALGTTSREHLSWQVRLRWLRVMQGWLHSAEREERIDFSHGARGSTEEWENEDLFTELAELASGPDADGQGDEEAESILAWAERRARHVRCAHEAGEGRADRRGSLRASVERREALRAAWIWTRVAEALEGEMNEPIPGKLHPAIGDIREELTGARRSRWRGARSRYRKSQRRRSTR